MSKAKEAPTAEERLAAEKEIAAGEQEDAIAAAADEAADSDADRTEFTVDKETGETRPRDWENDPEPGPHPTSV